VSVSVIARRHFNLIERAPWLPFFAAESTPNTAIPKTPQALSIPRYWVFNELLMVVRLYEKQSIRVWVRCDDGRMHARTGNLQRWHSR